MMKQDKVVTKQLETDPQDGAAPQYERPVVLTYRGQEILEALGPAQACSFNHAVLVCP